MAVDIITNGHARPILYWDDLSQKEQKEFDWLESCDRLSTYDAEFFRYRGWTYCLSDMMRADHFPGWDGYENDTFFSGILVKYARDEWGGIDSEYVVCATFYARSEF